MVYRKEIDSLIPKGLSLRDYQYAGVEFLLAAPNRLLASDTGLGKTICAVIAANYAAKSVKQFRVLVLCPKSVVLNWPKEILKWNTHSNIEWEVHNWDRLINSNYPHIKKTKYDLVIGDESHKCIKKLGSKRSRVFMESVVPNSKRVWLLSATPASISGLDYFGTLQLLLPEKFGDVEEYAFKKEFCNAIPDRWAHGGFRFEGFKNTHVLKSLFSTCALRQRADDPAITKQLPSKIYTHLEVEVEKPIVAAHLDIDVSEVIDLMERGKPLPGHIAAVMQATALAKVKYLSDIVEDLVGSYVVFAWHRKVVHDIASKILGAEVITGETSLGKRQSIIDKYSTGELKVIVCNMSAGGVGINLQKAKTAIYVEFPHSPADLIQSEGRIRRLGSEHSSVNIIRLIGKGTIDEQIFQKLDERMKKMSEVGV